MFCKGIEFIEQRHIPWYFFVENFFFGLVLKVFKNNSLREGMVTTSNLKLSCVEIWMRHYYRRRVSGSKNPGWMLSVMESEIQATSIHLLLSKERKIGWTLLRTKRQIGSLIVLCLKKLSHIFPKPFLRSKGSRSTKKRLQLTASYNCLYLLLTASYSCLQLLTAYSYIL